MRAGALALVAALAVAGCGSSSSAPGGQPDSAVVAVASSSQPGAEPFPVQVDHVAVRRIADGPRARFTAEPGDDRGNAVPAGSSVIAVTITVRNVLPGTTVHLPSGVPLEVRYGPALAGAEQIAPPASYREPTVVPAAGTADLMSLFLLPTADIVGAVVHAPLPQYDGTDIDAPRQTIDITKVSTR